MNIFVLDEDPMKAAQYHCDRHCVKMITESAQLLSSVHHVLGTEEKDNCYRLTHVNHPCAKWARNSAENYIWLYELYVALAIEFEIRYNKAHKAFFSKVQQLKNVPVGLENIGITERPLVMPEYCRKLGNPVESYRALYMKEKRHIANWKTQIPYWYF